MERHTLLFWGLAASTKGVENISLRGSWKRDPGSGVRVLNASGKEDSVMLRLVRVPLAKTSIKLNIINKKKKLGPIFS